ncbi:3-deoxy-D-manno-octulosonic acid transferase [Robertkochia solimangrovi]|uniref:3-deoxy-D-manno-octulosonic acid transferase n=1 Tax=Robertkochia solimangrovi TaxID=2213046 RepID=UPI0030CCD2EB
MKFFVSGRQETEQILQNSITTLDRVIWFHTASLGEFEQGLPVMEKVKEDYPDHKILVTFFSPSGYEVKKNSQVADVTCYLPMDNKRKVNRFLELSRPELAIFVKYEIWPNYLRELENRQIPAILISGIFRERQIYFKPWGSFMRKALKRFRHLFVQDERSVELLKSIAITNAEVSGDTRFDRVAAILERENRLEFMDAFKGDATCVVAGSTWPEDEEIMMDFVNQNASQKLKFVLAPHNIKTAGISKLREKIKVPFVLYSGMSDAGLKEAQVLILDTIGVLTRVYSYADIAYVGGGMGTTGLHNTLEPSVFGVPVIIGKNYEGFLEAEELVRLGGVHSVKSKSEFEEILRQFLTDKNFTEKVGALNTSYIEKKKGAMIQIACFIRKIVK